MQLFFPWILALVFLSTTTFASPPRCGVNQSWNGSRCVANSNPLCTKINALVTAVHQQASATAFCSSYLSVPVSTTTITSTSTLSTTSTATLTAGTSITTDATITVGATTTSTVSTTTTLTESPSTTITVTTTPAITSCAAPTAAPTKRGLQQAAAPKQSKPKPSCLSTFSPGAALSTACSCLSITPSTSTVTASTSSTLTITATATVPTIVHATSTITTTNTATTTTTISQTVTLPVTTSTQNVAASTTTLAIPTFAVIVEGGDNSGDYITLDTSFASGYFVFDDDVTNDVNSAQGFSLDSNGNLIINGGQVVLEDQQDEGDAFLSVNTGGLPSGDTTSVTCQVSQAADGTCPLACVSAVDGGTQSWDCGVYWRLGVSTPQNCDSFDTFIVGSI